MFGILSGGTTIEKDRCSVRCAAPEDMLFNEGQGDASVSPEDGRDAQDRRINGRLESEEETK